MSSKFKVGLAVTNYLPDFIGGVETRFHNMARGFYGLGFDVQAYSTKSGNQIEKGKVFLDEYESIPVSKIGIAANPSPNQLVKAFETLFANSADTQLLITSHPCAAIAKWNLAPESQIIFTPGYFRPLGMLPRLKRFIESWKTNGAIRAHRNWKLDFLTEEVIKRAWKSAIPSAMELDWITSGKNSQWPKLSVLPRGVDHKRWSRPRENRTFARNSKLRLLVACRLDECKDLEHVIKAVSHPDLKEVVLTICGEGPEEQPLKSLVSQLGITTRINFVGLERDMAKQFKEADVFVLSSKRESFANTALEAMSSGCILMIRRPNPPRTLLGNFETLRDVECVLKYTAEKPESFVSQIKKLRTNPRLLPLLSEQSICYAATQDWQNILSTYLPIQPIKNSPYLANK